MEVSSIASLFISVLLCSGIHVQGEHVDCAYERYDDFCDWTPSYGDKVKWVRVTGDDHTTGHGHYATVQGTQSALPGAKTMLRGPPISDRKHPFPQCFSLWYRMEHMGPNEGTLNIYAYNALLVSQKGSTSTDTNWHPIYITLSHHETVSVQIEVVLGAFNNSIHIDDIDLQPGNCTATGSPVVTLPTTPLPTIQPSQVDCSFDVSMCGWTQSNINQLDWAVKQDTSSGNYISLSHHRTFEHVTGVSILSGYIISPFTGHSATTSYCFYASVRFAGTALGKLVIETRERTSDMSTYSVKVLKSIHGDVNTSGWNTVAVNVNVTQPFSVILNGHLPSLNGQYSIDVDNIRLDTGACPSGGLVG